MRGEDILDPALAEGLDDAAAAALREWGIQKGISYELDRWLTNGRSTALVGLVYEHDSHAGAAQKLLLKLDTVSDGYLTDTEYRRQRDALRDSPDFAKFHLAELAAPGHDLVRVGRGRWIVFQRLATGSAEDLGDLDVLTKLLASVRSGGPVRIGDPHTDESVSCDGATFVRLCARIVQAVLADWAVKPRLSSLTVPNYLMLHLGAKLAPGQPLHDTASALTATGLRIPGESEVLPNPFALVSRPELTKGVVVRTLIGRAHGDLHTENILVQVRNAAAASSFRLIDLAKYDRDGPLARDPVYLVLYIALRTLPDLSEDSRQALIRLLLDPGDVPASLLPDWMHPLVVTIYQLGDAWALSSGFFSEWRQQRLLSLLGSALLFMGRASTREADRMWLLHLAARAARAHLGRDASAAATDESMTVEPAQLWHADSRAPADQGPVWVGRLCEYLPYMEGRARQRGRTAELDLLKNEARLGTDRTEEFVELVRVLGGPTDDLRFPDGDDTPTDAVYTCPLDVKCPRVERPLTGEPEPHCRLRPGDMRPEFW